MRQPNGQIPPSPEKNKNFNILAGCLKKTQFYRIVNLHTGAPPATGNPFLKIVFFWSFLTKTKWDQAILSHVYGKIWSRSTQFWFWSFEPFRYNISIQCDIFFEDTSTGTQTTETQTFFCAHEEVEYFNDNSNCDYDYVISSTETLWKATFNPIKIASVT